MNKISEIIDWLNIPEVKEKTKVLMLNKKEYKVSNWDTVSSIAQKNWIEDYRDLEIFNQIVWDNNLKYKSKNNITINIWDVLYIPKDVKKFYNDIEWIKYILSEIKINQWIAKWDMDILRKELNERIFPKKPQSIWVEKLAKWFINSQYSNFDPILPRIVDQKLERNASCSHFVKMFFMQAISMNDFKTRERKLFQKKDIDAWIFPHEAIKIWFEQKFNFMNNFSYELLKTGLPLSKESSINYADGIINMNNYLIEKWVPWSLVPILYKYSRYKDIVINHNIWKTDKHYNTHMSVYLWLANWKIKADEVWEVKNWKIIPFKSGEVKNKQITIIDFLLNFLQQRADHTTSVMTNDWRKVLFGWLKKYSKLVKIKVNDIEIDITDEINKDTSNQFKIIPTDNIEIIWPMFMDWLHMANSWKDRAEKMNARTRFLFEYMANQSFTPSELLEPWKETSFVKNNYNTYLSSRPIKWVFWLKKWEFLWEILKKQILFYEKEAFNDLTPWTKEYKDKLNYYYSISIKSLQLDWYLEKEDKLNSWATNVNRTIPYYDLEWINKIYKDSIAKIKEEKNLQNKKIDELKIKEYLQVQIYPWDDYWKIFTRILWNLEKYKENIKYTNIKNIYFLNDFLKKIFIIECFNNAYKSNNKITWENILNWKIIPWNKIIIHFEELDKIIYKISNNSKITDNNLKIESLDNDVIDLITPISQNRDILKTINLIESHIIDSDNTLTFDWKRILAKVLKEKLWKADSIWDFQIRIKNLSKWWWKEWPKKEDLVKAINLIYSDEWKRIIKAVYDKNPKSRKLIQKNINDVALLSKIINNNDLKKDDFKKIYKILEGLLKIDDWRFDNGNYIKATFLNTFTWIDSINNAWWNIVWKIIWWSLANDKINNNISKVTWMLVASWTNISDIIYSEIKQKNFEKIIPLTYNLWERKVLFWLTENFLIRVINKWLLINNFQLPWIKIDFKWSLEYWTDVFISHIKYIYDNLKYRNFSDNNKNQINIILLLKLEKIIEIYNSNSNKKTLEIQKEIYDLTSNIKLKNLLEENNIQNSILPNDDEFQWWEFRNTFFNYIQKTSKYKVKK